MDSIASAHADAVWVANGPEPTEPTDPKPGRDGQARSDARVNATVRSTTDPEATLTTGAFREPARPRYKQHTAVDERAQIIVDVALTTGAAPEERELLPQLKRIEKRLGAPVKAVTTDRQYGIADNYAALEEMGIDPVMPTQAAQVYSEMPISAFKFDARHDIFSCPRGRKVRFKRRDERNRREYRTHRRDCRHCPLANKCVGAGGVRTLKINDGYPALLRARRRQLRREILDRIRLAQHRWQVEGVHGEAKQQHGLGRAVRRGMGNVEIQMFLTAAVINLKRLAREKSNGETLELNAQPRFGVQNAFTAQMRCAA